MRLSLCLLAGVALLGACANEPTAAADSAPLPLLGAAALTRAQQQDLVTLRQATARFQRIDVADAAGYNQQFPAGCFTNPAGAMGYHYLNATYLGTLDVAQPQLLLYEPGTNGQRKLLGVEYILPGAVTDPAPVLFGQAMHYNSVFGVWALHVWAWENNPDGIFADWNRRVTCANAPDVVNAAMAHH